jgi:hypothetical protein
LIFQHLNILLKFKDGDYNKQIKEMYTNPDETVNKKKYIQYLSISNKTKNRNVYKTTNCLCDRCNNNQLLKIEKLKAFVPKYEVSE